MCPILYTLSLLLSGQVCFLPYHYSILEPGPSSCCPLFISLSCIRKVCPACLAINWFMTEGGDGGAVELYVHDT